MSIIIYNNVLFARIQAKKNKKVHHDLFVVDRRARTVLNAPAFKSAFITKSNPGAAGSVWEGGATECVKNDVCFEKESVVANDIPSATTWRARRDSNPQPPEPESDALSIEPRAHNSACQGISP